MWEIERKCDILLKNPTKRETEANFTCINNGTNFKLIISMCYVSRLTK